VVVGPTVVTNHFAGQNPVGRTVTVNGVSFQVVGVLESKGTNGIQDQDDIAIALLSRRAACSHAPIALISPRAGAIGAWPLLHGRDVVEFRHGDRVHDRV
jgi:MacB-like periplasmic core domain